jgi:hypothetical protein
MQRQKVTICDSHFLSNLIYFCSDTFQPVTPFDHLIPSDPFDLYWTMWNTNQSTFRGRHHLVLESLFIHHPQATVIMLSPTLNDTQLFLPFRHRGYRIYSFNNSLQHILQWNWYSNNQTKDFLRHWNSSGIYFHIHLADYLRTVALYLYGGTYLDMDALILQPLPNEEFVGFDRINPAHRCNWCVGNASNLYLAIGVMRFLPHREVLRHILEKTFDHRVYDPNCYSCLGPFPYTHRIIEDRKKNDSELTNLKLLEPHRLYPYIWTETATIFHKVEQDTSLELADLMKRSYSLHLFGHISGKFDIVRGSLIDRLFDQYDLGNLRPKNSNRNRSNNDVRVICPSLYIYTRRKQGRFLGRDVIYLRLNQTFSNEHVRWNITVYVSNGTVILPRTISLSNLTQAQINKILNELKYEPLQLTSIDTLMIDVKSETFSATCSITILIFSRWVTILVKTVGTPDRWPVIQRLTASVERYFPQTTILVASDSGQPIDKTAFLNFTSSDNINGYDLTNSIVIYDLPEDSGLSKGRNYLVNKTRTPFFFLLDDDFELEEDSHLDILLELIYTYQYIDIVAGKILEDIRDFNDFSGIFLRYNQTLELVHNVSEGRRDQMWFPRSADKKVNDGSGCRQVDFVPNVFMGRTESFRSVLWDDDLKVGEHGDFFVRCGQANRNVYTCRYINVHHRQIRWWKEVNNTYFKKRDRARKYLEKMLKKYDLKKLMMFGSVRVNLD